MIGIPASKDLGKAIARRRDDLGLKQPVFAERVGWSTATLGRVERGARGLVNEGEIYMVARALDLEPDELRARAEPATPDGPDDVTLAEVLDELRALRADVRLLLQVRDVAAAGEEAAKLADAISERSPARGDRS